MKKQKEKQEKIEQQRANEYKRHEELATTIIDASLWQNRKTVTQKMEQCTSEKERHEALKKQIQFRRKMLQQYIPDDKKFSFTYKKPGSTRYKPKPYEELQEHLFKFIDAALSVADGQFTQKINTGDGLLTRSIPLLVGKTVVHYMIDSNTKNRVPYTGKVIS